jgi:RNA polymerase-binding transcription factor DksA
MTMSGTDDVRTHLLARLEELRARIAHLDAELHQPLSADWEEQAVDMEVQDSVEGQERAALSEIRRIEATLRRIDDGSYGDCIDCGNAISPQRLAALPTAAKCIACAD